MIIGPNQHHPAKVTVLLLCCLLSYCGINAQNQGILLGKINNLEAEGVHVRNTSQNIGTVTNGSGRFNIPAKNLDTILISAINLEPLKLIVTDSMLETGLSLVLKDRIIELDGVTLYPFGLTGSLSQDITTIPKPISAESLNLPNASKTILTQSERKLFEADHGNFIEFYGNFPEAGIAINLHKILNRVSGRTNKLKRMIEVDKEEETINQLHSKYMDYYPELSESETYLLALKEFHKRLNPAE